VFTCNFNQFPSLSLTRLTRQVPLLEQELFTLPEHLSSPPGFGGVRVTRSLVLYVCLSFCTFSVGHCVVCSSSIYGFSLPLWYLETLLKCNYHGTIYIYIYDPDIRLLNDFQYICHQIYTQN